MPRRESKNGHEQTIVKHQVSVAEQVLMQVFGLKKLCPSYCGRRVHVLDNYFSLADTDTFIKL